MNAKLRPQTLSIKDWLVNAFSQLSKIGIPSARLDAEILLSHALEQSRTYLHSHDDELIDSRALITANSSLVQRLNRVPVAYIVGYKEFYGRKFVVTTDTLIPRPESEDIITILKQILPPTTYYLLPTKLVDIGTGSGCLGITAKLEFPKLSVTLADISSAVLKIAKQNSIKLSADVDIVQSDLLQNISTHPDIIIANLPYVDKKWKRSSETNFEPNLALFADGHGLSVIKTLINQSIKILNPNGYLIIEADPIQHDSIIEYANKKHLIKACNLGYITAFVFKPN